MTRQIAASVTCAALVGSMLWPVQVVGQSTVNINTAGKSSLMSLHGIGDTYAERIIQYRQDNDGFSTIEEIQDVKGIGPATFEDIKPRITVGGTDRGDDTDEDSDTESDDESDDGDTQDDTSTNEDSNDDADDEEDDGGSEATSAVEPPLSVSFSAQPQTILANSPVAFTANAVTGDTESNAARYHWNFGDGATDTGEEVTHTYARAGTYTVVVKTRTHEQEIVAQETIEVHKPALTIVAASSSPDGTVTIANNLSRHVSLTDWSIESGTQRFTFPERTYMPADSTITISSETADMAIRANNVALHSPNDAVVDRYSALSQSSNDTGDRIVRTTQQSGANTVREQHPRTSGNNTEEDTVDTNTQHNQATTAAHTGADQQAAVGQPLVGDGQQAETWPWLAALAGVVATAVLGALLFWPEAGMVRTHRDDDTADATQYTIRDISEQS